MYINRRRLLMRRQLEILTSMKNSEGRLKLTETGEE